MRAKIERLAPGGDGLCRLGSGRVCFIPYTAPGDEVEARVRGASAGLARGTVEKVLAPGPGRCEPECPLHFSPGKAPGSWCGGCDWQHLSYPAQLEAKRDIVRDCLFRIAKLREPRVLDTLPSPERWRYRNKVQVPFGGRKGALLSGFFSPHSHRIADFADCPVQPELSVRIKRKVQRLADSLGLPPYDEDRGSGWLRHLLVRTSSRGKALAALVTRTPSFRQEQRFVERLREDVPELVSLFQNIQPVKTKVVLGPRWRKLWGRDFLEERLGPLRLRVSPAAFLQVNNGSCQNLYETAREFLSGGAPPALLLDLYSGVGTIALWLSGTAGKVIGVEENRAAVKDAWANAELNGVTNARFFGGPVETNLRRIAAELRGLRPGTAAAVLDPPRAGCDRSVLKALRDPALSRVVYISCNPAAFARDADRFKRFGWRLDRVQPVDMFPQTSHVELVGLFERAVRKGRRS